MVAGDENIPLPDPTTLTTAQLLREILLLERRLDIRIAALIEVREKEIAAVNLQFALVERQRIEQKTDTKTAVDAALAAQKEAVREQTAASDRAFAKNELSTSKQLEQLGINFGTSIKAITDTLDDLKGSVRAMQGNAEGGLAARARTAVSTNIVLAFGGLVMAAVVAVVVVLTFAVK